VHGDEARHRGLADAAKARHLGPRLARPAPETRCRGHCARSGGSSGHCSPCNGCPSRRCANVAIPGSTRAEASNALRRAVFFHRLGEIRDRTFENQSFRASGLRPHHGRHRPLEHGLSRPRRSTLARPGRDDSRRSPGSCSAWLGAYRAHRRLRLDRVRSRHTVSAVLFGLRSCPWPLSVRF
jgi:hypothetical protein